MEKEQTVMKTVHLVIAFLYLEVVEKGPVLQVDNGTTVRSGGVIFSIFYDLHPTGVHFASKAVRKIGTNVSETTRQTCIHPI